MTCEERECNYLREEDGRTSCTLPLGEGCPLNIKDRAEQYRIILNPFAIWRLRILEERIEKRN